MTRETFAKANGWDKQQHNAKALHCCKDRTYLPMEGRRAYLSTCIILWKLVYLFLLHMLHISAKSLFLYVTYSTIIFIVKETYFSIQIIIFISVLVIFVDAREWREGNLLGGIGYTSLN